MSETDDTDVLLLIPPNFFLAQSSGSDDSLLESSRTVVHKPRSCTAQVIGKLVDQVQTLESRLESLEISTDPSSFGSKSVRRALDTTDSFESQSLDRKCFTFPRRRRRKAVRKDTQRETSLDSLSTNGKTVPPLQLELYKSSYVKPVDSINDTISMDGDISSIVSTPSKKTDKLLLNEIDEFLTKVESYESPDSKYKDRESAVSPDNIIKATGKYLCQKLGSNHDAEDQIKLPSGRIVSSHILDKYIYLVKNNATSPHQDKSIPSTSGYRNFDSPVNQTMESTTTQEIFKPPQAKSPSIRKLNFTDKDVQPTSTPKRTTQSYLDSFRPTSNKIYDRATKVLEQYKAQNSRQPEQSASESYMQKEFKLPQMRPFGGENKAGFHGNKLLDSIDTELLSLSELWGEKSEQERADRVDSIKLEEERLKREHCESIIQQLQRKILEQQEKLAVAIRVDRSKDAAITRLKEAWLKLTGSLDKAEERHRAALENMVSEVEKFRVVADDTQKKTNHFEAELYKALDLAHDYQEKCKQLTLEKKQLQEAVERELAEKQEMVDAKGRDVEVLKENYETVMRLNKQSTDCVKNLEDAFEKERLEHNQTKLAHSELTRKLQSAADDTALLAQERDILKDKVNEERARCNMMERQLADKQDLASELLRKYDTLDAENKSLRKHMELQKAELKTHYQKQLEDAVLSKLQEFQTQLDRASRDLERQAVEKENSIVDTFNKQFSRIEEQHKLEVNILEEKQREEIKLYRLQLAQASEKIGLLESKLESYRRRRGQIATQLHSVMESQWRQALLILTHGNGNNVSSLDITRQDSVSTPVATDYAPPKIPLTMPQFSPRGGGGCAPGGPPRERDGEGRFNFEALSDHELQHYVKLLLTKPANISAPEAGAPRELEEPTSDRPDKERKDKVKRSLNNSKPPWKS